MGDEMAGIGTSRVIELTGAQTHDLRERVLRDGTPTSDLVWPGDDLDTTVHLGVVIGDSDQPVAISTWLRQRSPDLNDGIGVQLRGMATDPTFRGSGLGALLLRTGLERAEQDGADHAWANARSAALDFYLAHDFEVMSDEFLSAATAIPHRRILQHISNA
jgi:ribosomal-protein-alanine N-acetyltransferase